MTKNEKIMEERGNVYGKYAFQANFVGSVIKEFIFLSKANGADRTNEMIGSVAYIAMKLARLAVSENHEDTIRDLENYCTLLRKMKLGE